MMNAASIKRRHKGLGSGKRPRAQALRGPRLTLAQYLELRLGRQGGQTAWFNFFIRPFGASSFVEFWRLWNPVYGYVLYSSSSYRPLLRLMPRPAAMLVTFVTCGFLLHDVPAWMVTRRVLPPGATLAFIFFGLGAVLSDAFRMDLSQWPVGGRAAVNFTYIAGSVAVMLATIRAIVH